MDGEDANATQFQEKLDSLKAIGSSISFHFDWRMKTAELKQHEQWKRAPEKAMRSMKVSRCQLPRVNPFYSSKAPKHDGSDKPLGHEAPLCTWCGTWKGDKVCGGCKMLDIVHQNTRPCIGAQVIKPNVNSFVRLSKHLTQALLMMEFLLLEGRELLDCLRWRVDSEKDRTLSKPIVPTELYMKVRDSQPIGMSGYKKRLTIMSNLISKSMNIETVYCCLLCLRRMGDQSPPASRLKTCRVESFSAKPNQVSDYHIEH